MSRLSDDAVSVAAKADAYIRELQGEMDTVKTRADTAIITVEQTCCLLEQKFIALQEEFSKLESQHAQLQNSFDDRVKELGQVQTQKHQLHLQLEKELIERQNIWLNEELTSKVNSLVELHRTHADLEGDMSAKLSDVEREFSECSSSLNWNKERARELEIKLSSLQEEFCSSNDAAAANEERFSAELSTVNKLVELYKESSEEWSRKVGELEGVIKTLETHLTQVQNDHKEKLEKEVSAKKQLEKEAIDLKEKLEKCETEIESSRKANELNLLPLSSFTTEIWKELFDTRDIAEDNRLLVPKIPVGVSGTALAASLCSDLKLCYVS